MAFLEAYFTLKEDNSLGVLIGFVKLAGPVRMLLDDHRSISRLMESLKLIEDNRALHNSALQEVLEDSKNKLKDSSFLKEVQHYQATRDREIQVHEKELISKEKGEKDNAKKREMEGIVKQAREEYMKKMHGTISSSHSKHVNSEG